MEVTFGPDTADLKIRMGINSGPGKLRSGAKTRNQFACYASHVGAFLSATGSIK